MKRQGNHVPPERSPSTPRTGPLTVSVKLSWWLLLYLDGVLLMQAITGLDPNMEKVERMVMRGVKAQIS